jgi:NTE family protein
MEGSGWTGRPAPGGRHTATDGRALVLGGGGLAGIAWLTGVICGLAGAGVDLADADVVIGTSAGATVAAQLTSDVPMATWFERQVDPALQNDELPPAGLPVAELFEILLRLVEEFPDAAERRRQVGALALATGTVPEAVRLAAVAGRIPGLTWPERPVAVTAVDAVTGDRRLFDRDSGVDLATAVAASSAVPGVWPPVTIGGARWVDGGIASSCNADVVAGYGRVLVLAPMPDADLADQVSLIATSGRVEVVVPDGASRAAFGANPLDPAVRAPSARAGAAQGRRSSARVAGLWRA